QVEQPVKLSERLRVGPVGAVHELAELEVNADHIGPESFHVPKIALDESPVGYPEIFDETSGVAVVEAPGRQRLARGSADEALTIPGHDDALELTSSSSG